MTSRWKIAVGSLLLMAACDASPDTALANADGESAPGAEAADPLAAAAARPGPYLVTYSDGTVLVSYASEDGTDWTGYLNEPPGGGTARWLLIDGSICLDANQDDRGPEDACLIAEDLRADGTWLVRNPDRPNGAPIIMRRLDAVVSSRADQNAAGTYLLDLSEDNELLAIFAQDGRAFLGADPLTSAWRAEGNQRCYMEDGEEDLCFTLISETDEAGVFTAEEEGETITVELL